MGLEWSRGQKETFETLCYLFTEFQKLRTLSLLHSYIETLTVKIGLGGKKLHLKSSNLGFVSDLSEVLLLEYFVREYLIFPKCQIVYVRVFFFWRRGSVTLLTIFSKVNVVTYEKVIRSFCHCLSEQPLQNDRDDGLVPPTFVVCSTA